MSKLDGSQTVTFEYNEDGLRTKKTVNGVVTHYILHGSNLVHLTRGEDVLHFFYDAQNSPAALLYNGDWFAYVKNLQGDVIGIVNASGTKVVEYAYDAWGKPISVAGTMAGTLGAVNPFRYRGYVYDEETGLYYLRSRYYQPEWGRFVSADKRIERNLYVYCCNSPTVHIDKNGSSSESIPDFTIEINEELQRLVLTEYSPRCIGNRKDSTISFATRNASTFMWFAEQMLDEGPISYKTDKVWNNTFGELPSADHVSNFYFRGYRMDREGLGNFVFGYLGSVLGIPADYLYFGAGVYKQAKRTAEKFSKTWKQALLDDPISFINSVLEQVLSSDIFGNDRNDYENITHGIEAYEADYP